MEKQQHEGHFVGKGSAPELIPLNLVYDYPVRWSKYKVLRDFVQNFYDGVGHHEWNDRFKYEVTGNALELTAKEVDFSYDWLIHIGASTKREDDDIYAGYFGEGFKIASLCALRDYGWNVEMVSRNWELKVVTKDLNIDNRRISSLAYHIWKKQKKCKNTTLWLYPLNPNAIRIFKSVLASFFYKENPLFGKEIWNCRQGAVYYRSAEPIPENYPSTYDYGGNGIIFAGYQALGSFKHPLIFCMHGFRLRDRERSSFYRMDVVKVIEKAARLLSPSAATEVLEALRVRWYDRPQRIYDFETWYHIIKVLTLRISQSPEQIAYWQKKYPHLLPAYPIFKKDMESYNRRRQATAWMKHVDTKYKLVQDGFLNLEYKTLEQVCEENDGFSIIREPVGKEAELINVLEQVAKIILLEFDEKIPLPPCKIIKSSKSAWAGMANCVKLSKPRRLANNYKIRFELPYVALKHYMLDKDTFGKALSTYLHEISHMFGGDASASFSHAITELLEIVLMNTELIEVFRKKWRQICENSDSKR